MASRRYSIENHTPYDSSAAYEHEAHYSTHSTSNHGSQHRNIISPPPGYGSPAPPDSPTPSSPSQAFLNHPDAHEQRYEDHHTQRYTDEPPLPPPHTADLGPNKRESMSRKPVAGVGPFPPENVNRGRPDADLYQVRSRDHNGGVFPSTQPPSTQLAAVRDQSPRGPSPWRYPQRPNSRLPDRNSYSANPFAAGTTPPDSITPAKTPDARSLRLSERSIPLTDYSSPSHHHLAGPFSNMPYCNSSHDFDPAVSNASINPLDIADDGDDGFMPDPQRRSVMSLGRSKGRQPPAIAAGFAPDTTAPASNVGKQAANASYDPVSNAEGTEKSAWLSKQTGKNRRARLWIGIGIGVAIVLAIVGAIVGGVLGTRSSQNSGSAQGNTNNAVDDSSQNGDLDINSAEIKSLMNNPNLHKVFPGIDYTPWGVQYPLCNTYPPSQNNVTRDVAVLSKLTNTIRLYGTDCNQTEMVLHAFDRLKLKNMKLWLGVWIDTNQTTVTRQMNHLYTLLEDIKDHSMLKGVIIGNEALFRAGETKSEASQEIVQLLRNTRQNFTSLGYDLPLGTSDLGDNWDATLAQASDFVMSNIHPFFAGVSAEQAASWTWNFWQREDVPLTASLPNVKQIISETGWPSAGGTDCGGADGSCAAGQPGATASVDNMNIFMNDWVCQALENGTEYFWFEAFDEPWKVQFNTPGREWEDKWGLMDSARKLKTGIKIPDCGGKTVS